MKDKDTRGFEAFRKRPVVVAAMLYEGTAQSAKAVAEFVGPLARYGEHPRRGFEFVIQTLEGDMVANPGDWVIRGVSGEHYPCKPDIFEATYERVEASRASDEDRHSNEALKPFWVSWYWSGEFTLCTPWWRSGFRMDEGPDGELIDTPTMVAAVMAESESDAKTRVAIAHDVPVDIEWRFVNEREPGWAPFCDRFPRADWMQWPDVEAPCEAPKREGFTDTEQLEMLGQWVHDRLGVDWCSINEVTRGCGEAVEAPSPQVDSNALMIADFIVGAVETLTEFPKFLSLGTHSAAQMRMTHEKWEKLRMTLKDYRDARSTEAPK